MKIHKCTIIQIYLEIYLFRNQDLNQKFSQTATKINPINK